MNGTVVPPTSTQTVEAPTAPASPAESSTPQSAGGQFNDAFSDLDKLVSLPERNSDKPKEQPKPQAKDKPQPDEPAKREEQPKDTAVAPEKGKAGAASLRTAYENLKKRTADLEKELATAKSTKPADDPNVKTYKERWEAAEKRREELEKEIKYSSYERSDEYKDKYHKPFENAYQAGRAKVANLKVSERTDEATGTVTQATRQATAEDFDRIMQVVNDGDAAELAEQLFGAKAAVALFHRERVMELNESRYRALDEFQKTGLEREQVTARQKALRSEQLVSSWQSLNKEIADKFPQWFQPDESDPEGNALLEKGYELATKAFSGDGSIPPEEMVKHHAQLRNRAAAFPREVYRNQKLTARVSELEKELAQFKDSEPKTSDGDGKPSEEGDNWERRLEAMATRR